MSSPQVLTFHEAPIEQARAGNREECLHYIDQAREAWQQLAERTQALANAGLPIDLPERPTLEQAEQEVWAAFGPDADGSAALRVIHEYYQSLKHPWTERIEAAERGLAEKSRKEREEAAEITRLRELEAHLVKNAEASAARDAAARRASGLQISAAELTAKLPGGAAGGSIAEKAGHWIVELATEDRIQRKIAAIVATAETEAEQAQVRERVEAICRGDAGLVVAHLEHLRLVRIREVEDRRRGAVEAEMRQRQAAELRRALEASLAGCEPMLSSLAFHESAEHRAALQAALALCDRGETSRAENEFESARQKLKAAAAQRPAVIAMVRELMKLGYQEITPMETVTAADINTRGVSTIQLGLPGHPEHLAEISFTQDASTVAVQAVRTAPTTDTAEQRAADLAAQTTLCADVDQVREEAGVQAFQPRVIKREDPGKAVPARKTQVRRGGVFARATSGAAQSAARARTATR